MTDNTYVVDQLVTGTQTITVTDDGTGSDWLTILGVYATQTDLRLAWSTDVNGNADEAMGLYFNPSNIGHRLVVEGVIENIRGSNGLDYIQGNELGNILMGDQAAAGPGDADSVYGYDGNDMIYGGAGNDDLGGGNDRDALYGGTGIDTIAGGQGIDTIEGGAGADVMAGGADNGDTVSYTGSNAGVAIDITFGSATTGAGGHAAGDQVFGFTHVIGSRYGDVITDTVTTAIGGGQNNNEFLGGFGNDRLDMGGGNDSAYGGGQNDTVLGGQGNDLLYGGTENDILTGGQGYDRQYGGTGADTFEFLTLGDSTVSRLGRDQIYDFTAAQGDVIDLSAIDARAATGANEAFTFIGSSVFSTGVQGQLRAIASGTDWLVMGDVNGDRRADFAILVTSATMLTSASFDL